MAKPKIGDERWLCERITNTAVKTEAMLLGWDGSEASSPREYCEPEDVAEHSVHHSLDSAVSCAREFLATGEAFYGCTLIDYQVFEEPHDDAGNAVDCPPSWETQRVYEVAMDMECVEVDA